MARFIDFVDSVLIVRDNSDIQRFNIIWHYVESDMLESRINGWILGVFKMLLENYVVMLMLI